MRYLYFYHLISHCRLQWHVQCISVATLTSPCEGEPDVCAVSSAVTLFFEAESELWVAPLALALFFMPETDPGRETFFRGPAAQRSQSPIELRVKTVAEIPRRGRQSFVCGNAEVPLEGKTLDVTCEVRWGRLWARHAKWAYIQEKGRQVPPCQQLLQVERITRMRSFVTTGHSEKRRRSQGLK